jgi:hypothetical protein
MIMSEDYLLVRYSRVSSSEKTNKLVFLGVISTFAVHPIDTLKVTMQYHSTHSIPKAVKLIIKLNSVRQYEK